MSYTQKVIDRFWTHVDKSTTCWKWLGEVTSGKFQYGRFNIGNKHKGTLVVHLAHRFSYELEYGPIPEGLCILHKCDVPACVRPNHLFTGTRKDNVADMFNKGRNAPLKGTKNGRAKVTEDLVRQIRNAYELYKPSQESLASDFGIDQTNISRIIRRQTWGHVT